MHSSIPEFHIAAHLRTVINEGMTTPSASPSTSSPDLQAVRQASEAWIRCFNAGDVDGCVAGYTAAAVMEATPMGRFEGHAAIDGFWRPFMGSGAGQLEYRDVKLRGIDEHTVELSASWSMNVGRGVITCERWVKQGDGSWRLVYDAFEIQEQYAAAEG